MPTRRPSASSGPIEARSMLTTAPASRASSIAAAAGIPERLAEQRVDRQVEGIAPPRTTTAWRSSGRELVGRAAVGDEAALAVGRDEDADPPGPRSRDAHDARRHAVAPERLDQRPAGRVAPDRRDQARARPEPAEPARRVRRRTALDERDPTRDVRPRFERHVPGRARRRASGRRGPRSWRVPAVRPAAEDGRAVPVGTVAPGAWGVRAPGSSDRRHARRIAGASLQ